MRESTIGRVTVTSQMKTKRSERRKHHGAVVLYCCRRLCETNTSTTDSNYFSTEDPRNPQLLDRLIRKELREHKKKRPQTSLLGGLEVPFHPELLPYHFLSHAAAAGIPS